MTKTNKNFSVVVKFEQSFWGRRQAVSRKSETHYISATNKDEAICQTFDKVEGDIPEGLTVQLVSCE